MNKANPRWVKWVVYAILSLSFLVQFVPLGRYPTPYIDEAFYNYPAIHYLQGKGFWYRVSSQAPNADRLWAYHGPFFPRMQIATFKILGIDQFAARVPDCLFAYVAVFLICGFLLARRMHWAALAIAVIWLGDRTPQEILLGRMDGVALAFLAVGYITLVQALERKSWLSCLASGASLGMAIGFHPVTAAFFAVSGLALFALARKADRWRCGFLFAVGAAIPAGLWLLCWLPDVSGSYRQFQYNLHLVSGEALSVKLVRMFHVLMWSRWWVAGICLAVVAYLIPKLVLFFRQPDKDRLLETHRIPWVVACLFSMAGLLCLANRAVLPYYLVYFLIWPILALAIRLELPWDRRYRVWDGAIYLLIFLCWLPSLGWNFMRTREMILYYHRLDHARVIHQIALPAGARVSCEPLLYMIAAEAGLDFEPVAWYSEQAKPPAENWVLLTKREWLNPHFLSPEAIHSRRILIECDGSFQKDSPAEAYLILGPEGLDSMH